jgi:hypothetical protein
MAGSARHDDGDGGDDGDGRRRAAGSPLSEWDCPGCDANNPCDERVFEKQVVELRCGYCGESFAVKRTEAGELSFREV